MAQVAVLAGNLQADVNNTGLPCHTFDYPTLGTNPFCYSAC